MGEEKKAWKAFGDLHLAGIRSYPAFLPFVKTWGLRLSTNAITRLGFEKEHIKQVANWIKMILIDNVPSHKINGEVRVLMDQFSIHKVKYGFLKEDI